jgi:hypothetical protein
MDFAGGLKLCGEDRGEARWRMLAFLESSYEPAAELGGWDRGALECPPGRPRVPRAV